MNKDAKNIAMKMLPGMFDVRLIAPCGMNCALCFGFIRKKNRCPGCNDIDPTTSKYHVTCRIKNCAERAEHGQIACYECAKFPCTRLRQLDKRYRTRYGMSMIGNHEYIREHGIEAFVEREKERWTCPDCGGAICVHRKDCVYCSRPRD